MLPIGQGARQGRDLGRFLQRNNSADHSWDLSTHTYTNTCTRTQTDTRKPCHYPPLVNVQSEGLGLWLNTRRRQMRSRTNRNTSRHMRTFWRNTKVGVTGWCRCWGASGWRKYAVIAAWQFSKCQPPTPFPVLVTGRSVALSLLWKSENVSCMTSRFVWILIGRTKTLLWVVHPTTIDIICCFPEYIYRAIFL